jgi:hypothetical protein
MRIDSSGNVGIGTSSPTSELHLHVSGASNGAQIKFDSDYGIGYVGQENNTSNNLIIGSSTAGVTFYAADSEAMRIDSSGTLILKGPDDNSLQFYESGSEIARIGPNSGDLRFLVGSTSVPSMIIDSSGNVGIGTSSPTAPLHVYESGSGDGTITIGNAQGGDTTNIGKQGSTAYGANSAGDAFVYTSTVNLSLMADGASSAIKFSTGGNSERMRIDSSGNLLVGTPSGTGRIQVTAAASQNGINITVPTFDYFGSVIHNQGTSGDNTFIGFGTEAAFTFRGSISYNRAGGLVAYNTTSDYRAKDIAGPIEDASSTVLNLKPYMGTMKGATAERPMFVAHETQEVAPYAVTGEKDAVDAEGNPEYQQMDHSALVPLLTAALQEALTEIADLKARVAALEA